MKMYRNRSVPGIALVGCQLFFSAAFAETVVFTNNTLITAGNLAYEGSNIVAQGCTVTIQGGHAFGDFTIQSNAVVDSASTNLGLQQLSLYQGTLRLAGGSVLAVSNTLTLFTNALILCQGRDIASTNASGQWVGAGVTIEASNVTVAVGGKISADGQGYTGTDGKGNGTGGGTGGRADTPGGGGGGGYGGAGGLSQGNCAGGVSYGLSLAPTDLGSAGGAGYAGAGGAGGGALRLSVAGELRLDGKISANGVDGNGAHPYGASGGGAGGSLWVTTRTLTGAGALTANGGIGPVVSEEDGGGGGGGRIAVFYADASGFNGFTNATASAGASFGPAGVGTTMFVDTGVPNSALHVYQGGALQGSSATYSAVTVYQLGVMSIAPNFVLDAQTLNIMTGATVTVGGGSTLNVSNALAVGTNATLLCQSVNNTSTNASGQWVGAGVTISASNVTVAAGGKISADAQGYVGTDLNGKGLGGGVGGRADTPGGGGGGGYGGAGGLAEGGCVGGVAYGSALAPLDLGSAGGAGFAGAGGAGGGALRLSVGGLLRLDGRISANGVDGNGSHPYGASGGGAGGSLWVTTHDLTGVGGLTAKGGVGPVVSEQDGGGGGGGRVAVYYTDASGYSGFTNSSASAGASSGAAGAGSLLFLDCGVASTNLHVFNTLVFQGTSATYATVTVYNGATLVLGSNFVLNAQTLNVMTGCTVTAGGGATVNVSSDLFVGSNSTVVCQSVNNTATNASGQWVGAGVTINGSNATVEAGGKISADGQGYVGTAVVNGTGLGAGGSARGSGGSHGGLGGYGHVWSARGAIYGSALQPTELGSSGGNYDGNVSGAGGGALRLNLAGTLTLNGTVSANGASGAYRAGAGSGGSLWVSAAALTGGGTFVARGGNYADYFGGAGGGGRIAVYYASGGGFGGFANSTAAGGIGWPDNGAAGNGAKGSVVFLDTSVPNMTLSVYENYAMQSTSATFMAMNVYTGATVTLPGGLQLGLTRSLFVASNATVTCSGANTASTNASGLWVGAGVTINASNVTVDAAGKISADGQGYAGTSVYNGTGLGAGGSARGSGGSHGGLGGYGHYWSARGSVYGSSLQPTDMGSSGGNYDGNVSGAGGGAVRLNLTGTLALNGTVSANGASGAYRAGAGAGGSLWVTVPTLTGSGSFLARGGNYADYYGGAGGGGRIAVYYAGGGFVGFTNSTAAGGIGWPDNGAAGNGAKGTLLFLDSSVSNSDLHVYENLTLPETALVFRAVNVYNGAGLTLQGTSLVCAAFNVYTGATVTLPGGTALSAGSLWVASNATVTCQGRNTAATNASGLWVGQGVSITVSNLTVDAGARLTADGQGYVGGQAGWAPGAGPGGGSYTGGGSSWYAGGGGYGGAGGSSLYGGTKGLTYGLALGPAELGSGGSADVNGSHLGGPGGGAIRLVVLGALTNNGLVSANGLAVVNGNEGGAGSGGSLWVTTATLAGGGRFTANGGNQLHGYAPGGGGGRIAIYYANSSGFSGYLTSTANPGASYSAATVGTVLFLDTSEPNSRLSVYQNYVVQGSSVTFGAFDIYTNATVTIPGGTALNVDRSLWVASNATVTCQGANITTTNASGQWGGAGVTINASNLTVDAGAKLTADRQGYVGGQAGWAPGAGPGGGSYTGGGSSWYAGGGGYGGAGGSSYYGGTKGAIYGLALAPVELGSGGSADVNGSHLGGPGGGAIRLNIQNAFTHNGLLSANGGAAVNGNEGGGGSGGSLWVTTATLAGGGRFTANGGDWLHTYGPGGGGGRIAVYYASGGGFSGYTNSTANPGSSYSAATVGTVLFLDTSVPDNALHVYQNGAVQGASATFASVTVHEAASLAVLSNLVLNVQTLSALTGATVTVGGGATVNLGSASLQSNATWVCQALNTATTNASGQWVGVGVTINASNLTVEAGAKISADAQGYVGWQADGIRGCGPGTSARVDDISPGAGYGGAGGSDRRGRPGGGTYGSPSMPTDLGSGAPPDERAWGGAGGGAIRLLVTGTLNHQGTISANGGNSSSAGSCESGAGSGGSVWVTAQALAGAGVFKANGGTPGSTYWGGAGGGGRVAVYYATNSGFSGFAASTANGGGGDQPGNKGTVGFYGTTGEGVLEVYQNYTLPGTSAVFDAVSVYNGAALTLGSNFLLNAEQIALNTGGTLNVGGGSLLNVGSVLLVASNAQVVCQGRDTRGRVDGLWAGTGVTINAESVIVDLGGKITADAQGYAGGLVTGAPGAGPGGGQWGGGGAWRTGGGGYGGSGGLSLYGGIPGLMNGALLYPSGLGSGGAADDSSAQPGGAGGGALRLNVRTSLINNGAISANGGSPASNNQGGGGSGGSVWICAPDLAGNGWYKANGGNQLHGYGAGGGGGRLAFYVATLSTALNAQCLGGTSYGGSVGDVRGSGGGSVAVVYSNALNVAQTNLLVTGGSGGSPGAVIVRRDSDFDGLADGSETGFWHTDTALADTDGDGVPDAYEASHGTDPTNGASLVTSLSGRVLYSGTQTGAVWVTAHDVAFTNLALRTSGSGYVNLGDKAALRVTNAITMSAWINLADATGDQPILVKEGSGKCSYWFGVYNYRFGFLLGTGAGWGLWARSSGSVTTGEWTHVASTWDGTNWCSYLNGELVASGIYAGAQLTSAAPVQLGQNSEWASTHFKGQMDEVRLWNRALTAEEIQSGMFKRPTGNETGLAGYWNFDTGAATDLTTNANHGTLVSDAAVVTNEIWGMGAYRTRLPTIPADYRIADVQAPARYTVSCFRDFNLNNVPEFWESQASYASNPVLVTKATSGIDMTLPVVVPPTAQAGGPYSVDEFSGNAFAGAWSVPMDGGASTDTVSGSTLLTYQWDLGTDGFDGTAVNSDKWLFSASGMSQSNAVVITGTGSWGARYFFGKDTCPRAAGMALEVKIKFTAGETMVGFKNTTADYSYTQMSYALYFYNYGIGVYEDGANRGWSGWPYAYDTWYDVRIELKATQGARYFYRRSGDSAWNLVYDSSYSAATVFRRGLTVCSGTTCTIDDLRELTAGKTPTYRLYEAGERPATLTVTDPTGLSDTNSTTVTTVKNAVPVAHLLPLAQTQYESNAVDRVWTFPFSATNSVDDHGGTTNGIYTYEWDWAYDGTFHPSADTAATVTHAWTNAGVYTVALRVTDHVLQTSLETATLTVVNGAPPTANPGGPYTFDEFTGNASTGAWNVMVSATNSSDNESGLVQYRWELGADTFDGTSLNPQKWVYSAAGVGQTNQVYLTGTGTWGQRYLFSADTYARVRGMAFETAVRFDALGHAMVGFKNVNTTYNYNQMPYAVYFVNNGDIMIYEDATSRGVVGRYATGVWVSVRIELKPTAGALYYVQTNSAAPWALLYDSSYGSATSFRRGADVHSGTFCMDDLKEITAGVTPAPYRLYEPGVRPVTLTVWDQALNTNSASTTMTVTMNQPPAAHAGGNKFGTEANCVGGLWSFVFSAAASVDDHGIYRYEWDWDYNAGIGFRPSGDTGVSVTHPFPVSRLGTNTVAVRVTDHVMQISVNAALVALSQGQPPVANAGGPYTTQVGSWLSLNGSASTDDNEVARYAWDFGDGSTGTGATPQHRYTQTNDYTVSLVVYDTCNQSSAMATATVHVISGVAPVAEAGGPYTGAAGGPPVYFDGRNSHDGVGSPQGIAKFIWDANVAANSDGVGGANDDMDLGGATPFFTYDTVGVYTAKLSVVDGINQSNTAFAVVTIVSNLAPNVICVPYHGNTNSYHPTYSGRAVTLKGIVRDAGSLTYAWNFGDGSTTAVQTVANKYAVQATHSYTGSIGKTYSARLTVWDSAGLSGTDTYQVAVAESNLETRAQIAVDEGLWWLHKDQVKTTGRWSNYSYGSYYASSDASALQAFLINGHRLDGWPKTDPYVETLEKGFRDLFTLLRTNTVTSVVMSSMAAKNSSSLADVSGTEMIKGAPETQASANAPEGGGTVSVSLLDINGNGKGIDVNSDRNTYELGMVMDALASSQARSAIALTGPVGVKGCTFYDLLTDMADTYIAGQNHSGGSRGGWRYSWNRGDADNSISQWGMIGLRAAEDSFGITCPQVVKTDNQLWLNASMNGSTFGYAGSGYADATYAWYSTTPSAMVQMSMDGIQTTNAMWRQTEYFITDNWSVYGAPGYNYYGLYAMVKALRLARPAPVVYLQKNSLDWYNDPVQGVKQRVTGEQTADGSWDKGFSSVSSMGRDLSTAWGIIMLTPTLFTQPPRAVITAPAVWGYGIPLQLTAEKSFSVDSGKAIVKYLWDFDNDGNFDLITTDPTDPAAVWTWPDPHPGVTGDVPSQVTIRLKVVDNDDPPQSEETFKTLLLAEPPHAPYAHAAVPPSATAGVLTQISGSGSFDIDPTDFITQYQWDFNNDEVPDLVTNAATFYMRFPTPGRQTVALRVVDNGVMNNGVKLSSEWDYVTLTVAENQAPVADAGGPYTAYEGRPVTLIATNSYDPNGDALCYAWDFDGDGLADSTNAVTEHTWLLPGSNTVWLTVNDTALSNSVSATFEVLAVNHAPSFTKGADQQVDEDSGSHTVPGWASGIGSGPALEAWQTLAFVCSNTAPALFSAPPNVSTNGTLMFTPAPNANGVATVSVYLQDNGGTANDGVDRSPAQTFLITVNPVNDAPSLTPIPDFTLVAGETLDYRIQATDSDYPGNTLTFTFNSGGLFGPPENAATLDPHTGQFTWSATDMDEGNVLWFAVTVTDNGVPPLASSDVFQASVSGSLPVLGLSMFNGVPHLLWNTVPPRRYQLQYKARLTDSRWNNLGGEVHATGDTEAFDDDPAHSHTNRFYKVLLIPEP